MLQSGRQRVTHCLADDVIGVGECSMDLSQEPVVLVIIHIVLVQEGRDLHKYQHTPPQKPITLAVFPV